MTDCRDGAVRDLLPDLVNDRLAADVRRRVDAHVGECVDCQQELALLHAMRFTLRRGPTVNVGAIAAAIPPYRTTRRSWVGWRAAAAVVLLAVGGGSVVILQRDGGAMRDPSPTAVASAIPAQSPIAPTDTSRRLVEVEEPREMAIGNPAIDELDDRELSTLLAGLESLEAIPSADEDRPADLAVRAAAGTD